jgi:hypothetical protein
MKVAILKTANGNEQILSLSNGAFTLGQNPITKKQVIEYDNLGVLAWESSELHELALSSSSSQDSAQQPETSDHAVVAVGKIYADGIKFTLSTKDGILYRNGYALSEDAATSLLTDINISWKWENGWSKRLAMSQFTAEEDKSSLSALYGLSPIAYFGALSLIAVGAFFAFLSGADFSVRPIVSALGWLMIGTGAIAVGTLPKILSSKEQ